MPKKHIFYGIAALAVTGILVGVIGYATNMRKMPVSKQQIPDVESATTAPSPVAKKKSCGCCTDRMTRLREQIHKARNRSPAAQETQETPKSTKETIAVSERKP
ncbi:hypothetical protein F4X10_18590 [Candidatus Poribacteria bacterium]|nr:hypothetical protein [Candidatus Poribacteria bacterium]